MTEHRVVITGVGLWTPIGSTAPQNWATLSPPYRPGLTEQCRAPLDLVYREIEVGQLGGFEGARELALRAGREALDDAGLWDGESLRADVHRVGCAVSASKPLFAENGWAAPDTLNRTVRAYFGIQGESRNVIAACATGAYSAAIAAGWIRDGFCDVVLAGSAEPYPHPLMEAGFRRMGVVSDEAVMRPFDRRRSGFVFGAGAAICVLESEAHARARKQKPIARLSGWGLGADPHSAVAFNSNGAHIANVIQKALARAELESNQISYVHAHGTATRLNDWIESQALMKAFGRHTEQLMISATKASTGHLLGAAGSAGFVFSVLALKHQFIPPTATLEKKDPECPLDYTPGQGHPARIEHALSLCFGFGGPIGALIVSAI